MVLKNGRFFNFRNVQNQSNFYYLPKHNFRLMFPKFRNAFSCRNIYLSSKKTISTPVSSSLFKEPFTQESYFFKKILFSYSFSSHYRSYGANSNETKFEEKSIPNNEKEYNWIHNSLSSVTSLSKTGWIKIILLGCTVLVPLTVSPI